MCHCPVVLGSGVAVTMAQAECQDLLLYLFQCQPVVIPHSKKLLYFLILRSRNMDRTEIVGCQTPGNERSIPLVGLNLFLSGGLHHGGGREDNAAHAVLGQLVIQCKPEAPSLITAYKVNILSECFPNKCQILKDLVVIRLQFLRVENFILNHIVATNRKIFFMDIHSDEKCGIIHILTSICMR